MHKYVIMGPQGSGKGTQAKLLARDFDLVHISVGDLFRWHVQSRTKVGSKVQRYMKEGRLVPDEMVSDVVKWRLDIHDWRCGFVLDGFPRTIGQAHGLEAMTNGDPGSWVVFDFEVPREVLLRRLSGRRWCPGCQATYHLRSAPPKRPGVCDACGTGLVQRADDHESVVAERLRQYDERTFPLIDYYRTRARMIAVDGNRPMDDVFRELVDAVEVRA